MLYSYAKLGSFDFGFFRFPGMGLGNLLFPWARAIVASKKYHLTPIAPTWFQLTVGPLLRNETDKRFYHGLFHNPGECVGGFKKLYLLATLKKIKEADFHSIRDGRETTHQDAIIVFEGMEGHFREILHDHELVLNELLKIVRPSHQADLNRFSRGAIGVHVRLGDFAIPQSPALLHQGEFNYRIPLSWYARQIRQIRRAIGSELVVHLFSDGTDGELSELLALPHVKRVHFGSSVADLIALSQSRVLVASGSSFSMWASFLGRMPVIWHPGQMRQTLYYEQPRLEVEVGEWEKLPEVFMEALSAGVHALGER